MVEYNGEMVTIAELAELLGQPYKEVYYKYRKCGIKRKDL